MYSRLQPDIDDRFHSYENSCELFNYLLSEFNLVRTLTQYNCIADSEDGPVPLQLPEQWLWDIVDEFIYQFQSFYVWRAKVKTKTEEELVMLVDGSQVRDLYASRIGDCRFTECRFGAHTASSTCSIPSSKSPRLTSLSSRSSRASQKLRSRKLELLHAGTVC